MTEPPPTPARRAAHLHPRVVPWQHALAWYEEAMRLFKRAPRDVGRARAPHDRDRARAEGRARASARSLSEIVTPLVACGLLYAAAAADRGASAVAARRARGVSRRRAARSSRSSPRRSSRSPPRRFAAWWIADVNLLARTQRTARALDRRRSLGIYAIGILAVAAGHVRAVPRAASSGCRRAPRSRRAGTRSR